MAHNWGFKNLILDYPGRHYRRARELGGSRPQAAATGWALL